MSEYQYYEFQAVDRPLTEAEMAAVRQLSSRATITPTHFQNVYNWGDFRGDPLELVTRYYDIFVYVANWGAHYLFLRLPRSALDPEAASAYCQGNVLSLHETPEHLILTFEADTDEEAGWVESGEGWLPSLLPLRADLIAGDHRALYLGWLAAARLGRLDEGAVEPPVPPDLGSLSASLASLADFLWIGEDLLAVAAERSPRLAGPPTTEELGRWVRALPPPEKDELLLRLIQGHEPHLRAELLRRWRDETGRSAPIRLGPEQSVGELLALAEGRAEARRREEAERAARERARQEAAAAAARAAHLAGLVGQEAELWRQVETLVEAKRQAEYERAVALLVDLRDLAERQGAAAAFWPRLAQLRAQHLRKPSLIARLERAGLR